ncbi:NHL repeat-containing protein 3-like isoform X2 [Amphiura filiformis]|uniref:NHL repeat-containing protein 3-like isoform X2 n=1 Tax=Amphiura filiformis TaxID=82378 RepID=UPI003B21C4F8
MSLWKVVVSSGLVLVLVLHFSTLPTKAGPGKASKDQEFKYKLDPSWPKNQSIFTGQVYCVGVDDKNGDIYVGQRGTDGQPVIVFGTTGELKRVFKNDSSPISKIHGMRMHYNETDKSSRIWLTDLGDDLSGHTVKRFSPTGKLELVLGTPNQAGTALKPNYQFDQVADLAISDNGEVYVVDGDGGVNNRLLKLDKDFHLKWHIGSIGNSSSQFHIPHSVELDSFGRVWVADRMNGRIQAFDVDNGTFLGQWTSCFQDGQPYSVRLSADKSHFVVAQLNQDKILLIEAPQKSGDIGDCNVKGQIEVTKGSKPHLVAVSQSEGAIYAAELGSHTCQKFVRKLIIPSG